MFESPFTAIISGATQTGKSQWIMRLLKHLNDIIDGGQPAYVLYCYSEINPEILQLKNDGIEIYNGVPSKEEIMSKPKNYY